MLLTFLPPGRPVGLLNGVVVTSGRDDLDVLHAVEHGELSNRRFITPQLVGVDDLGHVIFRQEADEEQPGSLGIAVFLQENVQYGSVFIHGLPQPVFDPADIYMPSRPDGGVPGQTAH
ncbi:hypothetical protein GCM10010841_32500 [Deinococcus aerophilus]|uniref:Uncharacterized protein n=1 Tax=Deinococcus aerophilus TaxID=522488 RepID=A0ABQ2GZU1_9DEIO|nr:hypothetical protein GCM10010841_32500 [Deinococcus aerophilus]